MNQSFGEKTGKPFDDIKDAAELREIIATNADTRMVDDYLQRVQGIKTALVFPPIIYGQGKGPVKPRSNQIPELARVAIQTRETVQVGKGESVWSNIYIGDLSQVFVALAEKAVQRAEGALWNENGLYLVGNKNRIVSRTFFHIFHVPANLSSPLEKSHRSLLSLPLSLASQTQLM